LLLLVFFIEGDKLVGFVSMKDILHAYSFGTADEGKAAVKQRSSNPGPCTV
jgi:hypothetical protein